MSSYFVNSLTGCYPSRSQELPPPRGYYPLAEQALNFSVSADDYSPNLDSFRDTDNALGQNECATFSHESRNSIKQGYAEKDGMCSSNNTVTTSSSCKFAAERQHRVKQSEHQRHSETTDHNFIQPSFPTESTSKTAETNPLHLKTGASKPEIFPWMKKVHNRNGKARYFWANGHQDHIK